VKKIVLLAAWVFAAAGLVSTQVDRAGFVQTGRATQEMTDGGLLAAHPTLPIGSALTIRNIATGREVTVSVTRRIPASAERVVDISADAARAIGLRSGGYVSVLFPADAGASVPLVSGRANVTINNHVAHIPGAIVTVSSHVRIGEPQRISQFSIIAQGDAAVTEIQDTGSTAPLAIVQTVPSFGIAVTDRTHHASVPLVFFFNNRIYLHSIAPNVEVTADGRALDGTIVISEAANGFAILTFTPSSPLPAGRNISIVLGQGLQSARGIPMLADVGLSFVAERGPDTAFAGNYGFERGEIGVHFVGDGAIRRATGPLVPFEGYYYAAISTGNRILSNNVAQDGSISYLILGPILEPFTALSFYYNFASAEFNEYIGRGFDDIARVAIVGPRGSYIRTITSVDLVGTNNMPFIGHPRLPDGGDSYVGYTGWRNFRIANLNVGSPAHITFTVNDVGDRIISSLLAIDAIELER